MWPIGIIVRWLAMQARVFVGAAIMAVLGSLIPIQSYAFCLGEINVSSSLGQPFKAEIPVTNLCNVGSLQVKLGSDQEFKQAGLNRSVLLTQLHFDIVTTTGQTKIIISSVDPVEHPMLDLLLVVRTINGRLISKYTLVWAESLKNGLNRDPSVSTFMPMTIQDNDLSLIAINDLKPSQQSLADNYGPVSRGYTLWKIANDTKPEAGLTASQMMMALFKINPSAFQNNNIN